MSIDELSKQYNDLSQQEANLEYRQSQLQKQLETIRLDLAKVQGKRELIEEMAKEMQGTPAPADREHVDAAEAKRESRRQKRMSANLGPNGTEGGVIIPDPEPEEEEA